MAEGESYQVYYTMCVAPNRVTDVRMAHVESYHVDYSTRVASVCVIRCMYDIRWVASSAPHHVCKRVSYDVRTTSVESTRAYNSMCVASNCGIRFEMAHDDSYEHTAVPQRRPHDLIMTHVESNALYDSVRVSCKCGIRLAYGTQ